MGVVEPMWESRTPDLVLVEGNKITDIFELKFVPHHYAQWKPDVKKLLCYREQSDKRYPVQLTPETGQWGECHRLRDGCLLHFVVVSKHDAEAVCPKIVREWKSGINHWFGGIGEGGGTWDIEFA